jgi:short-subunit dehydrogenase
MTSDTRPLAIVTDASAGISYELTPCCAEQGFDLLVADQPAIHDAAQDFRALDATVEAIEADLATQDIDRQQRIPKPKGRQRVRLRPV